MSRIDELIERLCPDGVTFYELKDVFQRLKGTPITAKAMERLSDSSGEITVFAGGKTRVVIRKSSIPEANIIRVPAVLVQSRGVIDVIYCDLPFTFKNEMWAYTSANATSTKYLFYYLKTVVPSLRRIASVRGSLPQISLRDTDFLRIPLPPMEIQEEIVRILDSFSELEAELEAELEKRRKQYAYYRDHLLSHSNLEKLAKGEVRIVTLGSLGSFYSGLTGKTKTDFSNGNAPYIPYTNIYNNIAVDLANLPSVKVSENEHQHEVRRGDVLITGSSETPDDCGMTSVVMHESTERIYLNSFCFGWRPHAACMQNLEPGFLKYSLRSSYARKQIVRTANGVTRFNISKNSFANVKIPIPPKAVQTYVIDILDKFDALVNDLSSGIPAEIEARRKQYEYYRDKLLTFKEKPSD